MAAYFNQNERLRLSRHAGARMAELPNLTKRAFLSGRTDAIQEAEAVMDLIQVRKPAFDAGADQTAAGSGGRESEEPAALWYEIIINPQTILKHIRYRRPSGKVGQKITQEL